MDFEEPGIKRKSLSLVENDSNGLMEEQSGSPPKHTGEYPQSEKEAVTARAVAVEENK